MKADAASNDDSRRRLRLFREAVLELSDEPTPRNLRRYLAASRLLDAGAARESHDRRSRRAAEQRR
jgi:hypothetical protein